MIIVYLLPRYTLYLYKSSIESLIELAVTDILTIIFSKVATFNIGEQIVNGVSML